MRAIVGLALVASMTAETCWEEPETSASPTEPPAVVGIDTPTPTPDPTPSHPPPTQYRDCPTYEPIPYCDIHPQDCGISG